MQPQAGPEAETEAIIVYNQQADAIRLVEDRDVSPARVFVEIRQDWRGLQVWRGQDRAAEALKLIHD
jgi:hypothetical protein